MRRLFVIALALTIMLPLTAVLLVFAAASSQAQCGQGAAVGPSGAPGVPSNLLVIHDLSGRRRRWCRFRTAF